ncbi:hypothetical protein [Psychromonas aquimarina]|uniref:hypothetical protein n=1 Tax=Psychromonas aquimarina TaxID=444919 RepID=UPI0004148FFF|nr:hypothetical protein [Psychromonas aquimarina]
MAKPLTETEILKAIKAIDPTAGRLAEMLVTTIKVSINKQIMIEVRLRQDAEQKRQDEIKRECDERALRKKHKLPDTPPEFKKVTKLPRSRCKPLIGKPRQKLNYEVKERKITVFKSNSLKLAFISTNIAYYTEAYEDVIARVQVDLAKRIKIQPLLKASDLRMEIMSNAIPVEKLNNEKRYAFDKLVNDGWKMLGNRPKLNRP